MKLEYMLEDDLIIINGNAKAVFKGLSEDGPHLSEILNKTNCVFLKQDIEYKEISLDTTEFDSSDSFKSDCKNIKAVYSSLRSLSDSMASDRRIWMGLAFGSFYNYMRYRWPVDSLSSFEDRYIIGNTSKRSLIRHGISRLWWFGRLTYDATLSNPYELTEYLCSKGQDCMENLCDRTVFDNFMIMRSLLRAMRDSDNAGLNVDRAIVREITKYVNILGANYVVDYLTEDDIYRKICDKIEQLRRTDSDNL